MEDKRIIKKYPNRRLYDTEESKYITLEDIKKLVLKKKEFLIKDVKTGEDLTKNILLQIIVEQEDQSESLFSTQSLSHIIRFYGNPIQSVAADYLQECIIQFVSQQEPEKLQSDVNNDSANLATETI
jgi:polyhydroxyalkanoate synthesis repressor PhaR